VDYIELQLGVRLASQPHPLVRHSVP
jgi:hypothetical protein